MEPVRMASDFANQPRIGERYIQSTAGAVSKRGDKGEARIEKVNVHRYIAGKKPEWAPDQSDDEDSDDEGDDNEDEGNDAEQLTANDIEEEAVSHEGRADHGKRFLAVPEVLHENDSDSDMEVRRTRDRPDESSDEEVIDDDEIERRREMIRARAKAAQKQEKDLLEVEEEEDDEDEEEEESSEYEEYSDSDEETGLRLKPVFVRKTDRVTIQDREKIVEETEMTEDKMKKILDERKKVSTKLVGEIIREEQREAKAAEGAETVDDIITDDENDEEEYEAWKLRELKRIKRDKDEKEAREREEAEVMRLHNMTEEERREEFRKNPKQITNKSVKGKYKFLQKYYHRGAFFMDEEENVYKQDFTEPTLEDHFEKTILPKVMQVKNFGRSGRTKYTHLLDQDTTEADSPWFQETAQSLKFHAKHGGGQKQVFEKPSKKR